jgi:hypothetical protein
MRASDGTSMHKKKRFGMQILRKEQVFENEMLLPTCKMMQVKYKVLMENWVEGGKNVQ